MNYGINRFYDRIGSGTWQTQPKCPHPGCPVVYRDPWRESQCVLNKPMLLWVPPGSHTHISCPAHPEGHVIFGSSITM